MLLAVSRCVKLRTECDFVLCSINDVYNVESNGKGDFSYCRKHISSKKEFYHAIQLVFWYLMVYRVGMG